MMVPLAMFGIDISWDATLRNVLLGSLILGVTSGVIGVFAVLRRQSLIGDALSHAALPGICIMFIITGTRSSELLLIGGAISGLLGTAILIAINRWSIVREESALGIVLSVFFGFGILLLTRIQHSGDAAQSGLDRFIFGQAATILPRDVVTMSIVALVVVGSIVLMFKEFKLITFDPLFAASIGINPVIIGTLLAGLLVLTIMIGLQTVGVILMVVLSGAFGMAAGVSGSIVSSLVDRLPTGPMIVIAASVIVIVSILFAPNRGLLATFRLRRSRARQFQRQLALADHHGVSGS
jgi:manganese/zinc/iron transport system permease protein